MDKWRGTTDKDDWWVDIAVATPFLIHYPTATSKAGDQRQNRANTTRIEDESIAGRE